nr:MAG TPA: hypothetical protein [Caudoviricetes sp.]DAW43042.1 MAG TPA: hypothetical protein [Bacteriophage sp.]
MCGKFHFYIFPLLSLRDRLHHKYGPLYLSCYIQQKARSSSPCFLPSCV